jgi:hypothetical protein
VPEWNAEVTVDERLAVRLIDGQFPELTGAPLRRRAEGWDNVVWLVDGRWAFRFPQRTMGVELIEREMRELPRLAPTLPAPIPAPVFAGRPAPALAAFLRALHDLAVGLSLPLDPNRRADMPYRAAMTRDWPVYGHQEGMSGVEREALQGLERALA